MHVEIQMLNLTTLVKQNLLKLLSLTDTQVGMDFILLILQKSVDTFSS